MAWEPVGHSRTSPMVLRWLRGVGTLRALKDIPDCPNLPLDAMQAVICGIAFLRVP